MNKEIANLRLDETGFGSIKIYQDPTDFCYGVDAVIVSDFAASSKIKNAKIIDLGCGNGIIPLILSHKTDSQNIIGVEKREDVASLAIHNVEMNDLGNRISIIKNDINDLTLKKESADIVVTNPPYVAATSGIKNQQNQSKMTARHETTASLRDFIKASSELLVNKGELYMVHRPSRTAEIINALTEYKLEPKIIRYVSPKRGSDPNIMLIKATKNGGPETLVREPLYIYDNDGDYSDEIMKIYER